MSNSLICTLFLPTFVLPDACTAAVHGLFMCVLI